MSIESRAFEWMRTYTVPGEPVRAKDIQIGDAASSVGVALHRLVAKGLIVRVGRGQFTRPAEGPPRRRPPGGEPFQPYRDVTAEELLGEQPEAEEQPEEQAEAEEQSEAGELPEAEEQAEALGQVVRNIGWLCCPQHGSGSSDVKITFAAAVKLRITCQQCAYRMVARWDERPSPIPPHERKDHQ